MTRGGGEGSECNVLSAAAIKFLVVFEPSFFRQIDVVFYNLVSFLVFGQFWLHLGRLDKQMLSYAIVN